MATTYVYLKHTSLNGGDPMQIYCTSVDVGFNKTNDKTANANYLDYPTLVHTVSRNNTKYILKNTKLGIGGLSYERLVSIINLANDDDDPMILNVRYGDEKFAVTTASISSGSDTMVVGDVISLAVGDTVSIKGAGVGGGFLTSEITAINSSLKVVSLTDTASNSVDDADVSFNDGLLLQDSTMTTTDIPVTVDGTLNITFDASDNKNASQPAVSINLVEVKKNS